MVGFAPMTRPRSRVISQQGAWKTAVARLRPRRWPFRHCRWTYSNYARTRKSANSSKKIGAGHGVERPTSYRGLEDLFQAPLAKSSIRNSSPTRQRRRRAAETSQMTSVHLVRTSARVNPVAQSLRSLRASYFFPYQLISVESFIVLLTSSTTCPTLKSSVDRRS